MNTLLGTASARESSLPRWSTAPRIGRPQKAENYRALVEDLLMHGPAMPTRDLLARAKLAGYAGGKTAFYTLVASVRQGAEPRGLDGTPGEICHHDFGEANVTFASGERRRLRFVASQLAFSSFLEISLVPDDDDESLARALVDHYFSMGGIPMLARFERPISASPGWSVGFACFAADLGIGIDIAPARGRAHVGLARSMKSAFFRVPSFADKDDVTRHLTAWCFEKNRAEASGAAQTPAPVTRLLEEQRRLRPLPADARDFFFRVPIVVAPGGVVAQGTHVYVMSAAAAGTLGTLCLGRDQVRIEAGAFEVVHPRLVGRTRS